MGSMKPFITIYFKNVIVFLLLLTISSTAIIYFTYSRSNESTLKLAKEMAGDLGSVINQRISTVFKEAENLTETTAGLLSERSSIDVLDPKLDGFFLNNVRTHLNMEKINFGTPNGSFIGAVNIALGRQTHYIGDPNKPLPTGTAFAFRIVDDSQSPPMETWVYKDKDLKTLGEEKFQTTYDSAVRPWYKGATQTKGIYWTDIYTYLPMNDLGITVSQAVYDEQGTLIGVSGIDLSLGFLSTFLKEQQIGKTGKAFIMNKKGELLIPPPGHVGDPKWLKIFGAASDVYKKENLNNVLFTLDKTKYLASVNAFSTPFPRDWLVIIIVPLNDLFGSLLQTEYQAILISLAILIAASLLVVYFSKSLSKPIVKLAGEMDQIKELEFKGETKVDSNIKEIFQMQDSMRSMKVALESFSRYVPKETVRHLLKKGEAISLGGEKKDLAIFFSDITGFSAIANHLPTQEVLPLLSEYFDGLSKVILANKGTIDKYIGDGIMAFWGAPVEVDNPARVACLTAINCKAFVNEFNRKKASQGKPQFLTRIGINLGTAIVGNVGTTERMNYTAIGDSVNIASRLQSVNKVYQTMIMINKNVREELDSEFLVRPIDFAELRGISEKVEVFQLVGLVNSSSPKEIELCKLFTEAYQIYHRGDLAKAKQLFLTIQAKFPDDYPTKFYLERFN